jgi:O-antigen ligase
MDTSGGVRLSMWKITFALFKHSPLYGYGEYEQFKAFLEEPFITSIASKAARETINNGPHNQLAAEVLRSGIFGLFYSLGTFVIPGIVFLRNIRSKKAAASNPAGLGLCVVVAFAVFSLAFEVFNLKFAVSFYGFLVAVLAAECLSVREGEFVESAIPPKSDEKAAA